jgi:ubiquinone/menaquinone biosynthesis C-methylase UbiE
MRLVTWLKNSRLVRALFRNVFVTGDNVRLVAQQPVIRSLLPAWAECALDAGTGSGEYARRLLLPRARQVVALDLNGVSLRRLRSRLNLAERGRCALVVGSVDAVPCHDEAFDLVLLCEVLEHCEDDGAVLDELWRVMTPGGTLLVSVPVPPAAYPDRWHVREGYTLDALSGLLQRHGFEVREHEYCLFRWSRAVLRLRVRTPVLLPLMFIVHLERLLMHGRGADAQPFDLVLRAMRCPSPGAAQRRRATSR